ncbi:hypothetical protein ACH3VR_07750 [Microbacterium sp. B2969]|uniref:TetR transcriptional regulator Rv1219c-like C-terminal domain-containing protein n=1 Tax=Microbacterium alkaliflavum TaxID=3248839 RepID=A0ABW7Q7V5_9MICO
MAGIGVFRARLDHLACLVAEPGPSGEQVFDAFLEDARRMLRDAPADGSVRSMADPDITALLLTASGLAPLILRAHLARPGCRPAVTRGCPTYRDPGTRTIHTGPVQRRCAPDCRDRGAVRPDRPPQRQGRR